MQHAVLIAFLAFCSFGKTLYVSPDGQDNGSLAKTTPGKTLQHAINKASNGDVIIALEGTYKGTNNHDLNFKGKTITVTSENPEDTNCVKNTIIDATGGTVAVRFIKDESTNTVFEGFTLLPGDTAKQIRGIKGYYEFSINAHPTTRHLRILPTPPATPKSPKSSAKALLSWKGTDPYNQPCQTTLYWGSGDVDGNGILNQNDVTATNAIIAGTLPYTPRADVNGDGLINTTDVTLIQNAIGGSNLPGWWNKLTTPAARNSWINAALTHDKTNFHPYDINYFVCTQFSAQLYINMTGYRKGLYQTHYDGGHTFFNMPFFAVTVASSTYGHAIDAILIGENPLDGTNWRFVEPQADYDAVPGAWDMPYGCQLTLNIPEVIQANGYYTLGPVAQVIFMVQSNGTYQYVSSQNILTSRPTSPTVTVDNRIDRWNPFITPIGRLLYEQTTQDSLHHTNIMLSATYSNIVQTANLRAISQSARILDAKMNAAGKLMLLWKEATPAPSVCYGLVDTSTYAVSGVTTLKSNTFGCTEGRLVFVSASKIHAFWAENNNGTGGVHWTTYNGSSWSTETNIVPNMHFVSDPIFDNHEWKRYAFDVALSGSNLILTYVDQDANYTNWAMRWMKYTTAWTSPVTIDSANIRGTQLASLSNGNVHMLYWTGQPGSWSIGCERGKIKHRIYTTSWSNPDTIDNSGVASMPAITNANDVICAIWEKTPADSLTAPVLGVYKGSWAIRQLTSLPNTSVWYPKISGVSGNHLVATWGAINDSLSTIGVYDTVMSAPVIPILGNNTIGDSSDKTKNALIGYRFQAMSSFSACSMFVYIRPGTTGNNMKLALYADNAGVPGALLKATNQRSGLGTGWKGFKLNVCVNITSGSWYWLMYQQNSNYSVAYMSTGGTRYKYSRTYGTFPNPAPSGTFNSWKGSIYAK